MKQVFEQYASAIISVLMATTVLAIILVGSFGPAQGMEQVMGQILGESIAKNSICENKAFDAYMGNEAPKIESKNIYLVKNKRVLLTDCFAAKSYSGESLPIYFKQAWTLDGEELDLDVSSDGTSICVTEEGAYWLQVYAVDCNQKEVCVQVKVLVNER